MLSLKKLTAQELSSLKDVAYDCSANKGEFDRYGVTSVDPELHLQKLTETVQSLEGKAGYAKVTKVETPNDLTVRPLVWLAEQCRNFESINTISKSTIKNVQAKHKMKRLIQNLDQLSLPTETKLQMLESLMIDAPELEAATVKAIQCSISQKKAEYKQQLPEKKAEEQGGTPAVMPGGQSIIQRMQKMIEKARKAREDANERSSSQHDIEIPVDEAGSLYVSPRASAKVSELYLDLGYCLNKPVPVIEQQLQTHCQNLLNRTGDTPASDGYPLQPRKGWPTAEQLRSFVQGNNGPTIDKVFIPVIASALGVTVECEIQTDANTDIQRFDKDGSRVAKLANTDIYMKLTIGEVFQKREVDQGDDAPRSLAVKDFVAAQASTPVYTSLKEQLIGMKLIADEQEYLILSEAWGKDCPLLQRADFPEKLQYLKLLQEEAEKDKRPFSYVQLALIHKSGLLDAFLPDIKTACDKKESLSLIYNDVDREYSERVFPACKSFFNERQKVNVRLAGPAMANWAHNCWFNASTNMLMSILEPRVLEKLKQKTYEGQYAEAQSAVRDAVVDLWEACDAIRSGKVEPHSVAGHQLRLMQAMHALGRQDHLMVQQLFNCPRPIEQHDANQYLLAIMDVLELQAQSEVQIATPNKTTCELGGKQLTRYSKNTLFEPMLQVPVVDRPGPIQALTQALTPEGFQAMASSHYYMADQQVLQKKLADYHNLENTADPSEVALKRCAGAALGHIKDMADRCLDEDVLVVDENMQLLRDCTFMEGNTKRRGDYLPLLREGEAETEYLGDLGKYNSGADLRLLDNGGIVLEYSDSGKRRKLKGVAVLDSHGCLARPLLCNEDYKPRPSEKMPGMSAKGKPVYNQNGCLLKRDKSGGLYVDRESKVLPSLWIEHLKVTSKPTFSPQDVEGFAQDIAGVMRVKRYLNEGKLNQSQCPVTFNDCLQEAYGDVEGEYDWSEEELKEAGLDIEHWYPHYLKQQGVNPKTVLVKGQTKKQSYEYHRNHLTKPPVLRLKGTRSNSIQMNTKTCRQFSVGLNMFGMDYDLGRVTKKGKQAAEVFNSIQQGIHLPVVNEQGQQQIVEGRLKHLVCHQGKTAESGHYISLKFNDDRTITVEDDLKVLELEEYMKYYDKESPSGKDVAQILASLDLQPYMLLFERPDEPQM
ncbi:ubiquitin carboxyl-terminal hydrolase [Sansalvadorimonas sp. 2012CJ34-2]|uniref:Ubiquitin carboxyl-terminal hydrolase n=1 Tax=Parendozoicomonas callyspongiae TaxID=2942213 RepID=A0ABT0PIX7_9GAMM|nr:ubiquitin carboxyl-terminal hydrolase [Sansalvadorimonas sp. 2012CJ34-2]MCL6270956.1 ubiquitin carboxyl-terminal hydrolase [Sansalvadorimonas sp. 2012CJ34-2]